MVSSAFPSRPFNLREVVTKITQDVASNTSTLTWQLWIDKTGYSPTWSGSGDAHRTFSVGGSVVASNQAQGFDFRGDGPWLILSGSTKVAHNADGTKSVAIHGFADYDLLGSTTVDHTYVLATIPRASKATFSPSSALVVATPTTINTNRATGTFTHTITFAFGATTGTIGTGVGASVAWTPPVTLLDQIPNSPSGSGTITTKTYSGATLIGTTTTPFTLAPRATDTPTWTSVSVVEGTPGVASSVGAFVQGVSKLTYSIAGAAGVQGSTIALYRFQTGTQILNGATGTTDVIAQYGNVPVTYLIQDTRGKQKTQTDTVPVLQYVPPAITSFQARRSLSDGTVDEDDGTYLRVDLTAVNKSLFNGTEKNIIQIKVYTKLHDAATWILKSTLNPGGITYSSHTTVAGPFDIDKSYDVRVEVLDRFSVSAAQSSISVAAVTMHWGVGIGIGKYHEQGALDVAGDIYSDKIRLASTTDASVSSTAHALQVGDTASTNLIIDNNEIMARNNGALSQLNLNPDGGLVNIGGPILQSALPQPLISVGSSAFNITGSAATFTTLTGVATASFGTLPRSLLVEVKCSAVLYSGATTSYARIGVAVSGGVTLTPTQDGYGNDFAGFTPFSENVDGTFVQGSKFVVLPTTSSTFTMQCMRLVATGTHSANYAVMQIVPLRWL